MAKRILWLLLIVALVPWMAWSQGERTTEERNRARLKRWKEQPSLYARLKKNASFFASLPQNRQQQILKLQADLEVLPLYKRAELLNTLERYSRWLSGLKPSLRQRVENAKNQDDRLRIIREIRYEQWLQKQPRIIRKQLENVAPAEKMKRIQKLQDAERHRRQLWQTSRQFWKDVQFKRLPLPANAADLLRDVSEHIDRFLMPLLSGFEKKQLRDAERKGWPWYPRMLVKLAAKYPPALQHKMGPTNLRQLPPTVQKRLRFKSGKIPKSLASAEGRYPQYISAITNYLKKRDVVFANEYWPYNAKGLSPGVRDFVEGKLLPSLSADEKLKLSLAEGKWPLYPTTLQTLARNRNLRVPWQVLPGPQEHWEKYQFNDSRFAQGFMFLPKRKLREFARFDLSAMERDELDLFRPGAWERLSQAYFRHKQKDLKQQRDDMENE